MRSTFGKSPPCAAIPGGQMSPAKNFAKTMTVVPFVGARAAAAGF